MVSFFSFFFVPPPKKKDEKKKKEDFELETPKKINGLVAANVTEVVWGVGRVGDVVLGGGGRQKGLDAGRGDGEVALNHGCHDAADVWRGHGGTRDRVDGVRGADPGRGDRGARGKDVGAEAVVGEVRSLVALVRGRDGDAIWGRGWGGEARVVVLVAGGDGKLAAGGNALFDGPVHGERVAAAEGHVGDASVTLGLVVVCDIVDASDDAGGGARAVSPEDGDGDEVGLR